MNYVQLLAFAIGFILAPLSLAQDDAVTETVYIATITVPAPSPTSSIKQLAFEASGQASSVPSFSPQVSTAATTEASPSFTPAASTSHSPSTSQPPTAQSVSTSPTGSPSIVTTSSSPDTNSGGDAIDSDAGASGSDSSTFTLSQGAIAAIAVVSGLVILIGIVSTVLYVIAKRRQWDIRASVARASRRLTGRFGASRSSRGAAMDRQSRRAGVHYNGSQRPGVKAIMPPGHKRGLVVNVKDVEKGPNPLKGKAPKNTRPRENTWIRSLWGNGWK